MLSALTHYKVSSIEGRLNRYGSIRYSVGVICETSLFELLTQLKGITGPIISEQLAFLYLTEHYESFAPETCRGDIALMMKERRPVLEAYFWRGIEKKITYLRDFLTLKVAQAASEDRSAWRNGPHDATMARIQALAPLINWSINPQWDTEKFQSILRQAYMDYHVAYNTNSLPSNNVNGVSVVDVLSFLNFAWLDSCIYEGCNRLKVTAEVLELVAIIFSKVYSKTAVAIDTAHYNRYLSVIASTPSQWCQHRGYADYDDAVILGCKSNERLLDKLATVNRKCDRRGFVDAVKWAAFETFSNLNQQILSSIRKEYDMEYVESTFVALEKLCLNHEKAMKDFGEAKRINELYTKASDKEAFLKSAKKIYVGCENLGQESFMESAWEKVKDWWRQIVEWLKSLWFRFKAWVADKSGKLRKMMERLDEIEKDSKLKPIWEGILKSHKLPEFAIMVGDLTRITNLASTYGDLFESFQKSRNLDGTPVGQVVEAFGMRGTEYCTIIPTGLLELKGNVPMILTARGSGFVKASEMKHDFSPVKQVLPVVDATDILDSKDIKELLRRILIMNDTILRNADKNVNASRDVFTKSIAEEFPSDMAMFTNICNNATNTYLILTALVTSAASATTGAVAGLFSEFEYLRTASGEQRDMKDYIS